MAKMPWVTPKLGKNNATATVATTNEVILKNQSKLNKIDPNELQTNSKDVIGAINEILSILDYTETHRWIVGEYKWMPVGSTMPTGWEKVNLQEGLTIVQGTSAGTTTGKVISHYHNVAINYPTGGGQKNVYAGYDGAVGAGWSTSSAVGWKGSPDGQTKWSDTPISNPTTNTDAQNNLAAGMYAELWQYKGVD